MAGARGVVRDSKPKRPRVARDVVAEERLADLERALEERVAEAIAAKDTAELLRLHGHFIARVRDAQRSVGERPDDATPAADAAVADF